MSTSTVLTFYDIPGTLPGIAWSPNTWKIRYCLNYKDIPYKTVWLEYHEIGLALQKVGGSPTSTKADGSPLYTVPAIYDPSTGQCVVESIKIASYLDAQYPDTPRLIPGGTFGLQFALDEAFTAALAHLWRFALPKSLDVLTPNGVRYFQTYKAPIFGTKRLEDAIPVGEERVTEWEGVKNGFGTVDAWYKAQETQGKGGFLMMGSKPVFVDFLIASFVLWMRLIYGEQSEEWNDVASWQGGRWARLLEELKQYEVSLDASD